MYSVKYVFNPCKHFNFFVVIPLKFSFDFFGHVDILNEAKKG